MGAEDKKIAVCSALLQQLVKLELDDMESYRASTPQASFEQEAPFGQLRAQMMGEGSQSDGAAFTGVLSYCCLILGGPILSFFTFKFWVFSLVLGWDADAISTNVASAVVAVVVLHLALGLFIFKAYFGSDEQAKIKIGKKD